MYLTTHSTHFIYGYMASVFNKTTVYQISFLNIDQDRSKLQKQIRKLLFLIESNDRLTKIWLPLLLIEILFLYF